MKEKVICELIKILKNKVRNNIKQENQKEIIDLIKLIHKKVLKIESRLRLYRAGIEYLGFERITKKKKILIKNKRVTG